MNGCTLKMWIISPTSRPRVEVATRITSDHGGRAPARLQQPRGDDRGQRHDRAHREVDAAGDDHEAHADREDDQVGVVDQQVQQHLAGEESPVAEPARDEDQHEQHGGHEDRPRLGAGEDIDDPPPGAGQAGRRREREAGHCDTATSATGFGAGERRRRHRAKAAERGLRLQQADRGHDGRLEHHRRDRRDADGVDGGHERLDHQCAHERAGEGVPATVERGAADDDGEDRVQLDEQAGVVGVGRRLVGREDQAGDRCAARRRTRTR